MLQFYDQYFFVEILNILCDSLNVLLKNSILSSQCNILSHLRVIYDRPDMK